MVRISKMGLRQSSGRPSLSTWVHGGRPGKNWNPVFVDFCCAGVGKIDFDALTQIIILRNHRDAPRTPDISITYRGRGRAGPKVLTGHHGRMPVVSIWNKYSRYLVNGPALLVISNVRPREVAEPATSMFATAFFFWWPFVQIYCIWFKYTILELIRCPFFRTEGCEQILRFPCFVVVIVISYASG